ncbi:DUF6286 domain-containing protein [Sphaerisporangium sp. TRM90804]|uniref:DUF6286 domain-containing protein n=1 Tax=Sphaerisporangium sp. TRM90804 TaxID=3031113 RepID=UPI00244BA74C|nr:DUF6286 domain-containing protein [Sphaerisporangium sp. TRM90804]MDH2424414.1 DUF6286 domain-containing protein [Sphaerisporangium sp. TRM90804]
MTTPDRDPSERPGQEPTVQGPTWTTGPDPAGTGHDVPAREHDASRGWAGADARDEEMDAPTGPMPVAEDDTAPRGHDGGGTVIRDREHRRAAVRAFRPRRTVPATIAAILLAAAAIPTVVGAVAAMAGRRAALPSLSWLAGFGRMYWDAPAMLTTSAVALLLGLVLLGSGLTAGRPRLIPLASADPRSVVGISRPGLRRHLTAVATRVDGVSRARVQMGRRVRVVVDTPLRDPGDLSARVTETVTARLRELEPFRPPPVNVVVRRRD